MILFFFSQNNSNTISFKDISKIVGVPIDDVELLVIHVLSIKLLTGHIDEQNEQLVIQAIKPSCLLYTSPSPRD